MTSVAERTRRKRKRIEIQRARTSPSAETVSRIAEIVRKVETVTVREDKPFAQKRENMSQCPIIWLASRSLITLPQRNAAMMFARDWFDAGQTPNVTATMEPTIPGVATWSCEDAILAYGRYRWVQVRLTTEAWPVLSAVVLHEKPVLEWLAQVRGRLAQAKLTHALIRAELADATFVKQTPEQKLRASEIEKRLKLATADMNELIVTLVDRDVAMRRLRSGLDELIMLRREFWLEHGEDGLREGEALTVQAEVERRELLGV